MEGHRCGHLAHADTTHSCYDDGRMRNAPANYASCFHHLTGGRSTSVAPGLGSRVLQETKQGSMGCSKSINPESQIPRVEEQRKEKK